MTTRHLDDLQYPDRISLAADEARTFAEQAEHLGDAIRDLYADKPFQGRDRQIAALHQRQAEAMKFAEIHSNLAIADAVQALGHLVDALLDSR